MFLQVFICCSSYLLLTFSRGAKFMDCMLLEFVVGLKVLMCSCGTHVILGAFGVFLECGSSSIALGGGFFIIPTWMCAPFPYLICLSQ
jgi:hypothetical protein